MSADFPGDDDRIGAAITNPWQLNFSEDAYFQENSNKISELYLNVIPMKDYSSYRSSYGTR